MSTEPTGPQLGAEDGGGLSGSSETDDCEEAAVCWHRATIIHHTDGLQELRPNKTTDPQLQSHSFDFCCADTSAEQPLAVEHRHVQRLLNILSFTKSVNWLFEERGLAVVVNKSRV